MQAIEISKQSSAEGGFPAGAVLVTKSGKTYSSGKSVGYYHGEMMVIDKAIEQEGVPLVGAVIYASMEPCLMCASKMFWSGVSRAEYIIPKSSVKSEYAYENTADISEQTKDFFSPITLVEKSELFDTAISIYEDWVESISKVNNS